MLRSLGFTIHPEKSVLKPTQNLIYLGFITNSKDMTLKLTEEKKKIMTFVPNVLTNQNSQYDL